MRHFGLRILYLVHILFCVLCISGSVAFASGARFISPSDKQSRLTANFEESFARTAELRKLAPLSREQTDWLNEIVKGEELGFLGYHGDSLDYYIYQDIIRYVMEDIVGISIRSDFHFFAVPLDPAHTIQTKMQLVQALEDPVGASLPLSESTFTLTFTLWDNLDRLGVNTLEHFIHNKSVKPLGYPRRLKWLFQRLGLPHSSIERLFVQARAFFPSSTGVILQVFDTSPSPYELAKKIAYPAYSSGLLAANKTVDEYFLDDSLLTSYPPEVRLLLSPQDTLNPHNALKTVRYTLETSKESIKKYRQNLRQRIQELPYNRSLRDSYMQELQTYWQRHPSLKETHR